MTRQLQSARHHALQKIDELLLAVLAAGAQFAGEAPALLAQIGRNRGIAVETLVGVADALLPGARVVHRKYVDIERYVLVRRGPGRSSRPDDDRRDGSADVPEKIGRGRINDDDHGARVLVEALAQARRRRHLPDAERTLEERIPAFVLDGIEIALGRAQQSDVALHAISVGDAMAQRDRLEVAVKARVPKRPTDQSQPRMGGQRISIRSNDLETPHLPSPAK